MNQKPEGWSPELERAFQSRYGVTATKDRPEGWNDYLEDGFRKKYGLGEYAPLGAKVQQAASSLVGSAYDTAMTVGRLLQRFDLTGLPSEEEKAKYPGVYGPQGTIARQRQAVVPDPVPMQEDKLYSKVAGAVGSSLPLIPAALTGGPLGVGLAGAAVGAESQLEEAEAMGATTEEKAIAAVGGALLGYTERFGVGRALSRVGLKPSMPGYQIAREILEEAVQEGVQTAGQDVLAKSTYDPERALSLGKVLEQAGVAAAAAGLISGSVTGLNATMQPRASQEVQDFTGERPRPEQPVVQDAERTYAQEFAQSVGAKLQFKPAAEIAAQGGVEPDKAAKIAGHYDRATGTVSIAEETAPEDVRPTVFHEVLAHHLRSVRGETFDEMQKALRTADPGLWASARAEAVRRRGTVGAETSHGTADEEATALTIETLDVYVAEALQKPDLEIKQPNLLHSLAKALVRMLGDLAPKALRRYAETPFARARHQGMAKIVAKAYFELRDSVAASQDAEAIPSSAPAATVSPETGAVGVSSEQPPAPETPTAAPVEALTKGERAAPSFEEQLAMPEVRENLEALASEAGWATIGGQLIREEGFQGAGKGKVIGRTPWVSHAPWWRERPNNVKMSEKATKKAVAKALAGQKLSPRERKLVEWMARQPVGEQGRSLSSMDVLGYLESSEERQAIQSEATAENVPVAEVPFAIKGKRLTMDEKLPTERKVEEKQEEMFGEKPKMVQKQAFDLPDAEVEKPRKKEELFAVAYHGSPYDFDEFRSDKIGTGEGAQAYGHGLYFTDKREIAEHYRKRLSSPARTIQQKARDEYEAGDDPIEAADRLMARTDLTDVERDLLVALRNDDWLGFDFPHQAVNAVMANRANLDHYDPSPATREAVKRATAQAGRTYQVDLAPADDEYLLWDKPLSEQSEKVRKALAPILAERQIKNADLSGADMYGILTPGSRSDVASADLRSAGIRGIKYLAGDGSRAKQEGTFNYVIFDPADVRIEQKFALKGDSLPDDNWREYVRRTFVDTFRPVTRLGAEQAVRLRPGRVYGELEKIERQFATPLKKAIADAGLTLEQAGEYVTARHAEDRNALILKRSKGKRGHEFDPGSGMRTSEARAILAKGLHPEIDRLVADLVARQRKILVDSGLVKQEAVDQWVAEFGPYYVPLQTVEDPDATYTAGPSLNVTGPKIKRAEGRSTLADNPILVALIRTGEAVQQAERNRVGQAFAKIVEENPSAEWNLTDQRPEGHALSYKVDGEQKWIATSRDDIARAFAALDVAKAGPVLKIARKIMSFLRAAITSRNPVFPFYNVPKDIGTAMFKGYLRHDAAFGARVAANALPAARGVWSTVRGAEDGTGKWAVMYRRMRDSGGLIGWKNLDSFDEMAKDWKKSIEGGVHPMRALGQLLDDANRATELGTRLATFEAALARGMSDADAAALSRDITVDFAKKGNWSQNASLVYLFFNANVQGTESIFRAMAARPAQAAKLAAFLIGMGYAASLASRMFADDDDWELMSESDKQHRFGVMAGDKFIGVPAPWGFNVLWYLGVRMEESVNGKAQRSNPAADLFSASLQAFSPLQGANPVQALSPTLARPWVEISQNEDFAGRSIRPYDNPYDKSPQPRSEQFFPSVNPALREATAAMNRMTGGNEVRSGVVDVSPEDVEHFLKFVAGGIGANTMRSITVAQKYAQGEPVRVSDWPAIRAYVTQLPESATQRFYYENLTRIEYAVEEKRKIGETSDRRALELASLAKNLDKRIKVLKQRGETEKVRALMAEFNTKMMQP